MNKKLLLALTILGLLSIPFVVAQVVTTTQVFFNVDTVVGFRLTLPGEGGIDATPGGTATTAIEFNSSTGTDQDIDARVVGGAPQTNTTPIFEFDNTGTVDMNISVILDTNTPACMVLRGATTHAGALAGTQINSGTPVAVANDLAPSDPVVEWYMITDFTACDAGDTTTRTLNSTSIQS